MPGHGRKKKSSGSLTLRVSTEAINRLKKDANEKQISVNTLANQIFASYIEWDMHACKARWLVVQREVLKEIFDALPDDEKILNEIATRSASASKDVRLMMHGSDSLDAFYSILKNGIRKCNFSYREEEEQSDGARFSRRFVIQHDMGRKWSIFFKRHYEEILNEMGYAAKIECTDKTMIIEVANS